MELPAQRLEVTGVTHASVRMGIKDLTAKELMSVRHRRVTMEPLVKRLKMVTVVTRVLQGGREKIVTKSISPGVRHRRVRMELLVKRLRMVTVVSRVLQDGREKIVTKTLTNVTRLLVKMKEHAKTNQEPTCASARMVTQDNTAKKTSTNVQAILVFMVVLAKTKLDSTCVLVLGVLAEITVK